MRLRINLCCLFIGMVLIPISNYGQEIDFDFSEYYKIRRIYEGLSENDETALPLIKEYIARAKTEKDCDQLGQAYLDGIFYSSSPTNKLAFADSTVYAAHLTRNADKISNAYLERGVVLYFQFKKFNKALDQYLKAAEYARFSTDQFYKNRLVYMIGTVRSYIGHYDTALCEFRTTSKFYLDELNKNYHPNIIHNNRRGYFNSIHQMSVCYRKLGNLSKADSLTSLGINLTSSNTAYAQEYGYFLKEKGIHDFFKQQYQSSISSLNSALKSIKSVNDFAWETVCYSYIGKAYFALGNSELAVSYFHKVDSIFNKTNFILPEVRDNYELLIDYYKERNDLQNQLYYSRQLTKIDDKLVKDFQFLSSKLYKEYDTPYLIKETRRIEEKIVFDRWVRVLSFIVCLLFLLGFDFRYRRRERRILTRYKEIEAKLLKQISQPDEERKSKIFEIPNYEIEQSIKDDILRKLDKFEKNHSYREVGLTAEKLAKKFETNTKYLTAIIQQYKGLDYKSYVGELRIAYITEKLYTEKKYLSYTIESLAEECGIGSRNTFSKKFEEINGLRPTDFIKNRLQDLNEVENKEK